MKKQKVYSIKDITEMSKEYGFSGRHTSHIRQFITNNKIKHCDILKHKQYKTPYKVYNQKVYDFFKQYFELYGMRAEYMKKAKDISKTMHKLLKDIQNEKD